MGQLWLYLNLVAGKKINLVQLFIMLNLVKLFTSDLDAVIKRANLTEYGLSSGIFTKDINKALRFAEKIDAGTVFINTYNKTDVAAPFGGFKRSGFGKDLGK